MKRNRQCEIALTLLLAFVLFACGASQRERTLKTTYNAVTVAEAYFKTWDAQHQDEIVAHAESAMDGSMKLAAYRASRAPVEAGFVSAYRTIATAMYFQNEDTLAGALLAWKTLQDALKQVTGRSWP